MAVKASASELLIATCDPIPDVSIDDGPLAKALEALGVAITARPWNEIAPAVGMPPVLVRSTWDYHHRSREFAAWLDVLEAAAIAVFNPIDTIRWNMDKRYLADLERAGVAIPGTRWIDRPDGALLEAIMTEEGWSMAVLKPRIGASAHGSVLLGDDFMPTERELADCIAHGGLLQEFLPEIQQSGEFSLVYIDGVYTHAARKLPRHGDYRVQVEHGGASEPAKPADELIRFADSLLGVVPHAWLYARVDVVETGRGPRLMELELIEPELFFQQSPKAAEQLASAIVRRIGA